MYPDYLIHYGVKGMKWGVRKKISKMSDAELQKAINRRNLERQYKAAYKNKSAKRIGAIAGSIFGVAAINVARNYVQKYMTNKVTEIETRAKSYKKAMKCIEDILNSINSK